jgi:hypothetical protein
MAAKRLKDLLEAKKSTRDTYGKKLQSEFFSGVIEIFMYS